MIARKHICETGSETLRISLEANRIVFSTENHREYKGRKWIDYVNCAVSFYDFKQLIERLSVQGEASYQETAFGWESRIEVVNENTLTPKPGEVWEKGGINIKKSGKLVNIKLFKWVTGLTIFADGYPTFPTCLHSGAEEHAVSLVEDLLPFLS